jgi:osmotically-inducible protein OsmY
MLTVSDRALHQVVLEELGLEPRVPAGKIGIAVEEGVVTLSGTVRGFTEKWAAQDAVKRIKGVRGIADELRVELSGMHRRDDTDIAKTAVELFKWDDSLPKTIQVEVEDGRVTLTGTVDWSYQRDAAADAIRKIAGIRDVRNAISINPRPVKTEELETMIESRFKRLALLDAKRVQVTVDGNGVTLSGRVGSFAERELARKAALSMPGVTTVDNRICVSHEVQ